MRTHNAVGIHPDRRIIVSVQRLETSYERAMKWSIRVRPIFLVALLLLVLALLLIGKWAQIPPRSRTVSCIGFNMRRILEYAYAHNQLPANLSVLPAKAGYMNTYEDAWGRTLEYQVDSEGNVTLRSLGADGQPGGEADARDIEGIFRTKDSQGRWAPAEPQWIKEPLLR